MNKSKSITKTLWKKAIPEHILIFLGKISIGGAVMFLVTIFLSHQVSSDYKYIVTYLNNNHLYIYLTLLFLATIIGILNGTAKETVINTLDIYAILYVLIPWLTITNTFELLPFDCFLKYNYVILLIPIISIIFIIKRLLKKEDETFIDSSQGYIIPDLQLSDLAKHLRTDIHKLDEAGLKYSPFAKQIAEAISSVKPYKAFNIGITGDWGSGKSSLIDLVLESTEIKEKYRIIKFNPWLYPDEKSLIQNFFLEWKKTTNDLFLHLAFDDYAKLTSSITFQGIRFDLPSLINVGGNTKKLRQRIERKLSNPKYKYIVILDDLDRLDKNEILEVAKLSRVIADFPNTVYLLSYSRPYIDNVLKPEGDNATEKYFDK